jgi:hypothetical protein
MTSDIIRAAGIIRRAAQSRGPVTLTACRDALRAAGLPRKIAGDVLATLTAWRRLADKRLVARTRPPAAAFRRRLATLPAGTPAERLEAIRKRAVSEAAHRALRVGAHDNVDVALTDDPRATGLRQAERVEYPYKGRFRGRARTSRDWTLTVPRAWRARVAARGLATPDGLLTLDATALDGAPAGVELFATIWAVQGRGNAATTARGYIARDVASGETYHGTEAAAVLRGLARKRRAQYLAHAYRNANLGELARGREHLVATLADAKACGACEYGVRAWAAAVGLDYARGEATLGDVLAGYAVQPAREARAIVLRVLRRARASPLAA